MNEDDYPIKAPGWLAIDQALMAAYPGQTPHQFTSKTPYDLQSQSPLPAVSVCEGQEPATWHYVTYGLTELFEKASPNAELSGFGFELTFRIPRAESMPPAWPIQMLQAIARELFVDKRGLDSGSVLQLGGPICPGDVELVGGGRGPTRLAAAICVPDPALDKLDSVHGSVLFLGLFGLTASEAEVVAPWDLARKVGMCREVSQNLVVEVGRAGLREDRRTAPVFRRYELKVMI